MIKKKILILVLAQVGRGRRCLPRRSKAASRTSANDRKKTGRRNQEREGHVEAPVEAPRRTSAAHQGSPLRGRGHMCLNQCRVLIWCRARWGPRRRLMTRKVRPRRSLLSIKGGVSGRAQGKTPSPARRHLFYKGGSSRRACPDADRLSFISRS